MVPLELLDTGEEAQVVDVQGGDNEVLRLAEMGIRQGAHVRMVKSGVPCIFAIDGHRFTYRGQFAGAVLVELTHRPDRLTA